MGLGGLIIGKARLSRGFDMNVSDLFLPVKQGRRSEESVPEILYFETVCCGDRRSVADGRDNCFIFCEAYSKASEVMFVDD